MNEAGGCAAEVKEQHCHELYVINRCAHIYLYRTIRSQEFPLPPDRVEGRSEIYGILPFGEGGSRVQQGFAATWSHAADPGSADQSLVEQHQLRSDE